MVLHPFRVRILNAQQEVLLLSVNSLRSRWTTHIGFADLKPAKGGTGVIVQLETGRPGDKSSLTSMSAESLETRSTPSNCISQGFLFLLLLAGFINNYSSVSFLLSQVLLKNWRAKHGPNSIAGETSTMLIRNSEFWTKPIAAARPLLRQLRLTLIY